MSSDLMKRYVGKDLVKDWRKRRIAHLLDKIKGMLLAPYVVLFKRTEDGTNLQPEYQWMMTLDADLGGDKDWQERHPGKDLYSNWWALLWLLRNCAQKKAYMVHGMEAPTPERVTSPVYGEPDIEQHGGERLYLLRDGNRTNAYFFKSVIPLKWWKSRCIEKMQGIKINSEPMLAPDGKRYWKVIGSIRIRKFPY